MLTFGSLFAGIGGIDLGLERAGMRCRWQVEIDDYANRVLEKHWPDVRRYRDVREVGAHNLEAVDVIAGGFPCQDVSTAGKRAGIKVGTRSGLWFEFARIVRELRPRYVLVENVAALLVGGGGLESYSENWPRAGMMRSGVAYALPTWAPRNDENDASSSPAWIPCECGNYWCVIHEMHAADCLCPPIEEWASDPYSPTTTKEMWPTPRASEWRGVGPLGSKSHKHRSDRGYLDATVQEREGRSGKLNPDWLDWLMGFPIGWSGLDDSTASATPSSRKSQSTSEG